MALSRIGLANDAALLLARSSAYAAVSNNNKNSSIGNNSSSPNSTGAIIGSRPSRVGLHASSLRLYPEVARLDLPPNYSEIFNGETCRFGPERARDMAQPLLNSQQRRAAVDAGFGAGAQSACHGWAQHRDARVESYDWLSGAVSLSGTMQTNVPKPARPGSRATYLNMPGGQWARNDKYLAEGMRNAHYAVYRLEMVRRGSKGAHKGLSNVSSSFSSRGYATSSKSPTIPPSTNTKSSSNNRGSKKSPVESMSQEEWMKLSRAERLRVLVRDYGRTVIVFHISISLVSLGIFYSWVSSGLDLGPLIEIFESSDSSSSSSTGGSSTVETKNLKATIMSEGSTFLIAYAVHKLFAPVRISATLLFVPLIVRYLRRRGILKAPVKSKSG